MTEGQKLYEKWVEEVISPPECIPPHWRDLPPDFRAKWEVVANAAKALDD